MFDPRRPPFNETFNLGLFCKPFDTSAAMPCHFGIEWVYPMVVNENASHLMTHMIFYSNALLRQKLKSDGWKGRCVMNVGNIFFGIPDKIKDELFEEIIRTDRFTLERIISDGNETPKDEWYDQDKDECCLLYTSPSPRD